MKTSNTTRHTSPHSVPRSRVTLDFPKENDPQRYWDILEQLDWLQYVVEEPAQKKSEPTFFDLFHDIEPDLRPLEEIEAEMYKEHYGN